MNRLHYFDGHNIEDTCNFLGFPREECKAFELKAGGYIIGIEEVLLTPGSVIRCIRDKSGEDIYDFFIITGNLK